MSKRAEFIDRALVSETDKCIVWPFGTTGTTVKYAFIGDCKKYPFSAIAHRVVCRERHGPPPSPTHHAEHTCKEPLCVNPRHVRWVTPTQNMARKRLHGTAPGKLSEGEVREIKRPLKNHAAAKIAARYKVNPSTISNIATGKTWGYIDE